MQLLFVVEEDFPSDCHREEGAPWWVRLGGLCSSLFSVRQVMSHCVESDLPSGCFEILCLYNGREQLHVAVAAMVISHRFVMSIAHWCWLTFVPKLLLSGTPMVMTYWHDCVPRQLGWGEQRSLTKRIQFLRCVVLGRLAYLDELRKGYLWKERHETLLRVFSQNRGGSFGESG